MVPRSTPRIIVRSAPRLTSLLTHIGLAVRGLTPATTQRLAEMALAMHEAVEAHGCCNTEHLLAAGFTAAEVKLGSEASLEALLAGEAAQPEPIPFPLDDIRRLRDARERRDFRAAA